MALPITGHRRPKTWRLEIVPPPGETWRVEVERERSVAGEVLLRNGHMERDCLRSVSIAITDASGLLLVFFLEWRKDSVVS